jgi:hypothetical protein
MAGRLALKKEEVGLMDGGGRVTVLTSEGRVEDLGQGPPPLLRKRRAFSWLMADQVFRCLVPEIDGLDRE